MIVVAVAREQQAEVMTVAVSVSEVMLISCGLLAASPIRVALPRTRSVLPPMPLVPAQKVRGEGNADHVSKITCNIIHQKDVDLGAPPPHALSCSPAAECTP